MYKNLVNKSMKHNDEITWIWLDYNKKLTGSSFISLRIYDGVYQYRPNFQSEILNIMYQAGYERAKKELGL